MAVQTGWATPKDRPEEQEEQIWKGSTLTKDFEIMCARVKAGFYITSESLANPEFSLTKALDAATKDPRHNQNLFGNFLGVNVAAYNDAILNAADREFLAAFNPNSFRVTEFSDHIRLPSRNKAALTYLLAPYVRYFSKDEIDCIVFSADLSALVSVDIHTRKFTEKFVPDTDEDEKREEIDWEAKLLGKYNVFLPAKNIGTEALGSLVLPLNFVHGLADGNRIDNLCRAQESFRDFFKFEISGFKGPFTLSVPLVNYLQRWKNQGGFKGLLQELLRVGAMNSVTFQIVTEKLTALNLHAPQKIDVNPGVNSDVHAVNPDITGAVSRPVSTNRLRAKDVPRLKRALQVSESFSFGKWAIVLDFETKAPQSAYAWLHRMESDGFLQLTKSENGVSVSATDLALKALKLFLPG